MTDTLEAAPRTRLAKPSPEERQAEKVRETYRRMGVPVTEEGVREALRVAREGQAPVAAPAATDPGPGPVADGPGEAPASSVARRLPVRPLLCLAAALGITTLVGREVLVVLPAERQERIETQRRDEINAGLLSTLGAILATRPGAEDEKAARSLARGGLESLRSGDADAADSSLQGERTLLAALEPYYTLRVVSRPSERYSVLYRTPVGRPEEPAFYAVVEAIGPDGRPVRRQIRDAETGETSTVLRWGQRIERSLYQAIADDKGKDGTVDDAVLGTKERGKRDAVLRPGVLDGAITRW